MGNLIPPRDLGHLLGDLLHREQSFGQIRGLDRAEILILDRIRELEQVLELVPNRQINPETLDNANSKM